MDGWDLSRIYMIPTCLSQKLKDSEKERDREGKERGIDDQRSNGGDRSQTD